MTSDRDHTVGRGRQEIATVERVEPQALQLPIHRRQIRGPHLFQAVRVPL